MNDQSNSGSDLRTRQARRSPPVTVHPHLRHRVGPRAAQLLGDRSWARRQHPPRRPVAHEEARHRRSRGAAPWPRPRRPRANGDQPSSPCSYTAPARRPRHRRVGCNRHLDSAVPRWLRCPACRTLSRYDSGKFQLDHPSTYRPHEARYVHGDCTVTTKPTVMPVRFVLACPDGHLDDFPWGAWAHRQQQYVCPVSDNPQSNLALEDVGLAQRPTSQKVVCRHSGCDHSAAVQPAFGPDGWKNLPKCGGGRPHLGDREECSNNVVALLVGATNLWFADRRSVLSIPHDEVPIVTQIVRDNRPDLRERARTSTSSTQFAEAMDKYDEAELAALRPLHAPGPVGRVPAAGVQ